MNWLNNHSSPENAKFYSHKGLFLFVLMLSILVSAFVVVYLEQSIRALEQRYHSALEDLYLERNQWGVLMLEKGHLESPTRIEKIAKEQLQMRYPQDIQIIYLSKPHLEQNQVTPTQEAP